MKRGDIVTKENFFPGMRVKLREDTTDSRYGKEEFDKFDYGIILEDLKSYNVTKFYPDVRFRYHDGTLYPSNHNVRIFGYDNLQSEVYYYPEMGIEEIIENLEKLENKLKNK